MRADGGGRCTGKGFVDGLFPDKEARREWVRSVVECRASFGVEEESDRAGTTCVGIKDERERFGCAGIIYFCL